MNAKRWVLALVLAAPATQAATVLEYEVEGRCATDFTRMAFDGLQARIDNDMDGSRMSTLFDDSEQMMYLLMHDSRQFMAMESDDDAVDFQGDVGRSTMLYSDNQLKKVTGTDMQSMMAQAQAAMAGACPELAEIGFSDPDFAAAQQRCMQKNGGKSPYQMDARMQQDVLAAMAGKPPPKTRAPAAKVRWNTADVDRDGDRRTVAGLDCTMETTRRGETVLREQCMVPLESLGLDAAAMRRLKRITQVGQGMSAGIASLNPEMNRDAGEPARVALERTCYEGGQPTGRATLGIRRDVAVDAGQFSVPAGYAPMRMEAPGQGR
jgi:hypothetical protein